MHAIEPPPRSLWLSLRARLNIRVAQRTRLALWVAISRRQFPLSFKRKGHTIVAVSGHRRPQRDTISSYAIMTPGRRICLLIWAYNCILLTIAILTGLLPGHGVSRQASALLGLHTTIRHYAWLHKRTIKPTHSTPLIFFHGQFSVCVDVSIYNPRDSESHQPAVLHTSV